MRDRWKSEKSLKIHMECQKIFAFAQLVSNQLTNKLSQRVTNFHPPLSQWVTNFRVRSANELPIFVHAQPTSNKFSGMLPISNRFSCMLSIRGNHNPFKNQHSNMLSIRGTYSIAGWACAETISSLLDELTGKCLKNDFKKILCYRPLRP